MSYLRVEPVGSSESAESWSSIGQISNIDIADSSVPSAYPERVEPSRWRRWDGQRRSAAAVKIQRWFRHVKAQLLQTESSSSSASMSESEDTAAEDGEMYAFDSPSIQHQSSFDRYVEEQYLITLVMVNEKSISSLTEDQQETVRKLRAEIKGPPPEEMQAFREVRHHHSHNESEKLDTAPVCIGDDTAEEDERHWQCAKGMMNAITPGDNDPKVAQRKTDDLSTAASAWSFKPKEAKQKADHAGTRREPKVSRFGKCIDSSSKEAGTKQLTHARHQALKEDDVSIEGQHGRYLDNGNIVTLSTEKGVHITDTAKYSRGCGEVQEESSLNMTRNRLHTKNKNGTGAGDARPTIDKVSLQFKKKSKLVANSKIHGQRVPQQKTGSTVKEFRVNRFGKFAGEYAHQLTQEPSGFGFCSHEPIALQHNEEGNYAFVELGHPTGMLCNWQHNMQTWDNQRALLSPLPPLCYDQKEAERQNHVRNKNPQPRTGYLQQHNEPRRSSIRALQTPVYRPPPQKPAGSYLLRHLKAGVRAKHRPNGPATNGSALSTPGLGYSYGSTQRHAPPFHMHTRMPTRLPTCTDLSKLSVPFKQNSRQAAIHPRQQGTLPVPACSWPPQSHSQVQKQQSLRYTAAPCGYQTNQVMTSVSMTRGTWATPAPQHGSDYSRDPRFGPNRVHLVPIDEPSPGPPPPYSFQPHRWHM